MSPAPKLKLIKKQKKNQERETKINPKSNQANGKPHRSPRAAAPRRRQLRALVGFQFSRRGCEPAGLAGERCGQAAGRAARHTHILSSFQSQETAISRYLRPFPNSFQGVHVYFKNSSESRSKLSLLVATKEKVKHLSIVLYRQPVVLIKGWGSVIYTPDKSKCTE